MSHYGPSPASICSDIMTALAVLKAPTGKVRTIRRLAGELHTSEKGAAELRRLLTSGTPAYLVAYLGGPFKPRGTHRRVWDHVRRFAVIAINASFQDQADRFETAADGTPGIEEMLDVATRLTMRALLSNAALRGAKPLDHKPLRHEPEGYVYSAEFECVAAMDGWDDEPATILDTLGIVHSPTNPADLWEADNVTPKSDWPPTADGGVTEL